jgi:hypothetical protein
VPALNFKAEFADAVESGRKRQTIRRRRKRPVRPGDTLHLYTGMRSGQCRKLGEAVCASVQGITIYRRGVVVLDGKDLSAGETFELARADGFANTESFIAFFREHYGLPFEGVLIKW